MRRNTLILSFSLIFVLGIFILWQYSLYRKLSETVMSCGGDWSYGASCPLGTYCQSLGEGKLAGGLCKPFLSPFFEVLSKQGLSSVKKDKKRGELELKSRSSGDIFLPKLGKVKVYLYAPDEKILKVENIYCGAPLVGATVYHGHYQLILDASTFVSDTPGGQTQTTLKDSTIDISELEFIEGTYHDGQILIEQLDPNGYKNFIVIYNYGSCNGEMIRVYGYDLGKNSLVLYKFRNKSGELNDDAFLSPTANFSLKPLTKSKEGNLITKSYSQITGKNEVSEWKFVGEKGEFQEIRHYQESL